MYPYSFILTIHIEVQMMKTLTRKLSQISLLLSTGLLLAACGSGDSAGTAH